jgi:hypothetical protein
MDYRVQLLRDIKINLHDVLSDNVLEQSVDIITCLIKNYEIYFQRYMLLNNSLLYKGGDIT